MRRVISRIIHKRTGLALCGFFRPCEDLTDRIMGFGYDEKQARILGKVLDKDAIFELPEDMDPYDFAVRNFDDQTRALVPREDFEIREGSEADYMAFEMFQDTNDLEEEEDD